MFQFIFKKIFNVIIIYFFSTLLAFGNAKQPSRPLRVLLDWFVNPDHAPILVAQEKGFFKKYGLNVQLIPPADPSDTSKLVAVGQADIGITYEPQFMQYISHDLPLIWFGTLIATPLNSLVVLKNGSIHTINDLKGKQIGYSEAGSDDIMLKTMLKAQHMTVQDVKLINVHYGLTQALLAGRVDAITGAMRNFEPFEIEAAGKNVRLFYPEENGMPLYDELILITNKKEMNDPRLKLFLKAMQEGTIFLINHPLLSWNMTIKKYPQLNNSLNKNAWFATLPRFALRPNLIDKEQAQAYEDFLYKNGFNTHKNNLQKFIIELSS